jgi:hypothetical protein
VTSAGSQGAEIRLRGIRSHEGSQARAWEELAFQLRPPTGADHVETRKTRAPDAGVEWYEVYSDGHQEGFQAKFHARLEDALGGMRESVEAVCKKRPNLTRLTFVVPYDFTDSGTAKTTTDQDRWGSAVASWRNDFAAARGIEFATIRAGDITAKLTLKEHAGRREYWFGGLEITDEWLRQRFVESVRVAGERYTPQADSPSSVNAIVDAVAGGPTLFAEFDSLIVRASTTCRHDIGMWGDSSVAAFSLIDTLDEVHRACCGPTVGGGEVLSRDVLDVDGLAAIVNCLIALAYSARKSRPDFDHRKSLAAAISALHAVRTLCSSTSANVFKSRAFALIGPAGQGKTHALMRAVDGCLERGAPALAILGQRLSDKNWWPAMAESLDGVAVSSDVFLQALDSMAEARQRRALVVIDALNESQSPQRWRDELPAMLAQFQTYPHLALVVSYRTDYRDVVVAPQSMLKIQHTGLAGSEAEALVAYCGLFGIPVPSRGLFEPAFASPLFLRMYCEVIAADPSAGAETPTRSTLFERYAVVIAKKVASKLDLPPTSSIVSKALTHVADSLLINGGRPVPRDGIEREVDGFLPDRTWPNTLFQQLASEGLIELTPTYDGTESVGFPFQAYSEHLLSRRLFAAVDAESNSWARRLIPLPRRWKRRRALAKRVADAPWSWRSLALLLPEEAGVELVDLLPANAADFRLQEGMRESLVDRSSATFGTRAMELLREQLTDDDSDGQGHGIETVLAIAPRENHPGNADWLHLQLVRLSMADRDATWSIRTFQVDQRSDAYRQLTTWAERVAISSSAEEVRLASLALMWLFSSPNRFLRDGASKTLVTLLSHHLEVAAPLMAAAQQIDDPYVQERVLTCSYGAVLVGGAADIEGVRALLETVSEWALSELPIDVIARDSARGIAAWAADHGLLPDTSLAKFTPPYGAKPPDEPPTREELEAAYGPIKDLEGKYSQWRASSILHSCLDWYGDFNKYVVKSDVEFFSWHPLSGPAPSTRDHHDALDEVDVNWAGRWIANRAISLGWTTERFEEFERNHDLRRGQDSHKAERFGKKYQWIGHRELLARLADNFHPAYESWRNPAQSRYEGPWVWLGRDFDPTLPPSVLEEESQVCPVTRDEAARWAALRSPAMEVVDSPDVWVSRTDDLPSAPSMFFCTDPDGRQWVAIQRYSTWDRDNALRTGMYKRERDVFFLQFSWLVPRGQGGKLYDFISAEGLSGRGMPENRRTYGHYLGETSTAPIVATAQTEVDDYEIPRKLRELGVRPRPAAEQYVWEGSTLDCSIDVSVSLHAPSAELLGSASWVGHRAEWAANGRVIARAIQFPDGENGQDVLVVDADWLNARLRDLDSDLFIGTLSERHALPLDDDDFRHMAFSDVCYAALVTSDSDDESVGPFLKVRARVDDVLEASSWSDGAVAPDEPFDPASI